MCNLHHFFIDFMIEQLTFLIYYSAIEKFSEYSWVLVIFKFEFFKIYYLSLEIFNNLIFLSDHLFGLLFLRNLSFVLHFFRKSSISVLLTSSWNLSLCPLIFSNFSLLDTSFVSVNILWNSGSTFIHKFFIYLSSFSLFTSSTILCSSAEIKVFTTYN